MWKKYNHNSGKLVSLILRRDRLRIAVWLIAIVALTLIIALAYPELASTDHERAIMAETMKNPAITAMFGPGYGLEDYHYGAMMGHQMLLFTALGVAIMSILLFVRHTRGDEESGRIEMIRSLPAGRLSNLTAATFVMFVVNILLALLVGLGLAALGIEGIDFSGSMLYGAVLGVTGIFFTAVTALFAQLSESSRGAGGLSFASLGIFYLVRAIGDVGTEKLSWLSPLGWVLRAEVYVNNYWWPVIMTAAAAVLVMVFALYLNSVRDLGAGIIPSKPGRKNASPFLKNIFGLALRLQRTSIIAWSIGMLILGASYGSVLGDIEGYLESMELLREMLPLMVGFSLTEQFLTMLMAVMAMICAVPVILTIFRLRAEEKNRRTEQLFAKSLSRTNMLGSYLLISFILSFLTMFLSAVGLWSAGAAFLEEPLLFSTVFKAAMVYLPALWLMMALAVFFTGCMPNLTIIPWLYLGYSFLVVYMGALMQFPEWMAKLSPFGNTPQLPVEEMSYAPVAVITVLAIILIFIGFIGYNKRDIEG